MIFSVKRRKTEQCLAQAIDLLSKTDIPLAQARDESPPPIRFQLPGFGLPLNYAPRSPITTQLSLGTDIVKIVMPGTGEGRDLFPTLLNGEDLEGELTWYVGLLLSGFPNVTLLNDGFSLPRSSGNSLPLTTNREFALCRLMNSWTNHAGWEGKV